MSGMEVLQLLQRPVYEDCNSYTTLK